VPKIEMSFKKCPMPVRHGRDSGALQGIAFLTCFYGNGETKSSKKC
jgi:hypothetical protein